MPRLRVAGEDVFYAQRLSDELDRQIVFIHGAGGTHRHWGLQMQSLTGANLYSLDLPGHGRSGGEGSTSIAAYAEWLSSFLEALGLTCPVLVGHSMGGAIVQAFALGNASSVSGLILVGTGARLRVLPSILKGLLDSFESTVDLMLGYAYSDDAPRELLDLGKQEWLANSPMALHGDFYACDRFDVMDRLGEIHCPALVLCGEEDRLTPPKYSQFLLESIADSVLAIIPGAGHMVMLENPEQLNLAIEDFLERTAA